MNSRGILLALVLSLFAACSGETTSTPGEASSATSDAESQTEALDELAGQVMQNPTTGDFLPLPFARIWAPARVGFEEMVDRRVIRAVVPYGGYQFYYDVGRPRGATYELVQRFETFLNEELKTGNVKVYVVVIPVSRDELLPSLEEGRADIVAADLTITDERSSRVDFSIPLLAGINEVVVTGPEAPEIDTLEDLAGTEIFVRESSSYFEHLQRLSAEFESRGLAVPVIVKADELLEAEDILEMLDGGLIGVTVVDEYKAEFWAKIFPNIQVRNDLVINEGGEIAWATRTATPELMKIINRFLRRYGRGTLVGNDTYNRYLTDAARVRCAHMRERTEQTQELAQLFRTYGARYDFQWLMLAAQGYQESGLRQSRRSPAGAIGVMQVKPSTAADPNVGIDDVSTVENNIHAGAKYMRFLADRYFSNDGMDALNQWFMTLAAYNAGPAKVAAMRREAEKSGYDPNRWFDQVEIIAAQKIGKETVTYVSNIFKYYIGYQVIERRHELRTLRHGDVLEECL
jgi:membrane-bound lytic murein transglycosylase MltF